MITMISSQKLVCVNIGNIHYKVNGDEKYGEKNWARMRMLKCHILTGDQCNYSQGLWLWVFGAKSSMTMVLNSRSKGAKNVQKRPNPRNLVIFDLQILIFKRLNPTGIKKSLWKNILIFAKINYILFFRSLFKIKVLE